MDDKERTLYCGNISEKVTEDILYELFLQAGPLESVKIPKEKDGRQKNYAFVTFKHAVSVPYAIALMGEIALYGKSINLKVRSGTESAPNPYLEQLRLYQNNFNQVYYQNNHNRMRDNNRSRRHDSRRYESRSDSDKSRYDSMNSPSPLNSPGIYPGYNQPYFIPQGPYSSRYDVPPNQWSGRR